MIHWLGAAMISFVGWIIGFVVTLSLFPAYGWWTVILAPLLISGGVIFVYVVNVAVVSLWNGAIVWLDSITKR